MAALAVCWFHFTAAAGFLPPGALRRSGTYGWLGVECFFVISAFVIPLSMHRGGFALRTGWRTFAAKRITRLDPPYLATVVLSVALAYASAAAPGYAGVPPHFTAGQLLAHLGYLNAFVGDAWVNPVFWTLAIEFQYYVLIAVLYGGVASADRRVRIATVLALAGLGLARAPEAYVLHFLTIFAIGIATFQRHTGLIGWRAYALLLPLLVGAAWWALGPAVAAVAVATALTIAFVRVRVPRALLFLGTISYSLYLVHVPVGSRVEGLGSRIAHGVGAQTAVVVAALAASIVGAWVMYRWIERPAQAWSAAFRYRANAQAPTLPQPAATPESVPCLVQTARP